MKKQLLKLLPDALYIRLLYRHAYGRFPNLQNPTTFDEKIQWYKLHHRNPVMATLADKFAVRKYLEERGFGQYLNELYGVYGRVEEIDLASLPESFVLKATHGTNMNIICRDKTALDWDGARRRMNSWLVTDHYQVGREWAYKRIKPRIVCEQYLENRGYEQLIDYKFYCYDGMTTVVWACSGRFSPEGVRYTAYDRDWKEIPVIKGKPAAGLDLPAPERLAEMWQVAAELSTGFPFVRVDLYALEDRVIFGELTFYPDSGVVPFSPDSFNRFFADPFKLVRCRAV